MGTYANTDAQGQVIFSLPEKDYKVRADYLGSQYWSELIFWQDKDIDIDHGKTNIHVTNFGKDIENAKVYLFTETGSYLGKYERTDSSGSASFTLPVKLYKFRVDYSGSQYWSGEITPLPHGELDIDLALDPLALNLTNNPKPVRFDGVPIEYQPDGIVLASIGSLTGILTQSIIAQTPEPKIYYYINDHLGTPMKVIDENNTIAWSAYYKPFGEADITVDTFNNNFRFPGQYYDNESNLHYNYHRYYDFGTGRYIKPDPIGLYGGLNLFIYTINNPINYYDPLGLDEFDSFVRGWTGQNFSEFLDSSWASDDKNKDPLTPEQRQAYRDTIKHLIDNASNLVKYGPRTIILPKEILEKMMDKLNPLKPEDVEACPIK